MKKILESFVSQETPGQVQLYFFFHRRGDHLQYTQLGLFRTILFQLLIQVPTIRGMFKAVWEKKKRSQGGEIYARNWQLEELREIFSSLLLAAAGNMDIKIFIDALDEAGEDAAKDLLSYLYGLSDDVRESQACVSICFSCRKYPIFANHGGLEIWADHENYDDIATYTAVELDRQLVRDSHHEMAVSILQADFVQKALGVFLWVALMVPIVAKQYNDGDILESVRQRLSRVSSDLSQIYEHIMKNVVNREKRPKTLRLMQLIFLAERPLSHIEMHDAIMFDDDTTQRFQYAFKGERDWEDFPDNDPQLERSILSLSGGLAETNYNGRRSRKAQVQFIHESVNDFWREDHFRCLGFHPSSDPRDDIHYQLCLFCLQYLKVVWKLRPSHPKWKREDEVGMRFPFTLYASTGWIYHARKAESRGISLTELLHLFEWPSQSIFVRCMSFYVTCTLSFEEPGFVKDTTLLHVATAFNLVSFMRALLENGAQVDQEDCQGKTAMTFAVAHHQGKWGSSKAAVQLLVEYGANLDTPRSEWNSPLSVAADLGDEAVVQILVDNGADLNACYCFLPSHDNGKMTPLVAAAKERTGGSAAIVGILLDNGAEPKALSGLMQGQTVLFVAAYYGNIEVVRLMLERGAEMGPQDHLLLGAVGHEGEEIIGLLLEYGVDVNDEGKGPQLGSALMKAIRRSTDTMVKILLDAGADIARDEAKYGSLFRRSKEGYFSTKYKTFLILQYGYGRRWALKTGFTLERTARQGSAAMLRLLLRPSSNRSGEVYQALLQLAKKSKIEREGKVKLLLAYKYGLRWLNNDWVSAAGSPTQVGKSFE